MTPAPRLSWPVWITALVHAGTFAWAWPYIMDDALITYRYARHVGEGLGPYWNVGGPLRPVEGFSSLLHMFLLGGLHGITGIDVEWLGKTAGLVFSLATIVSIGWMARRDGLTTAGTWLALSPFLLPPMVMATSSGMETPLYILLAWLTSVTCVRVLAATAGRSRIELLVALALLGTLTRPEFGVTALALFALVAWRRPDLVRSLTRAVLLLYVLPGLLLTGWRFALYGDVVPNTFYVKQRLPGLWGLGYVWRFVVICAAPYLLIAAPSLKTLWRERRDLVLVVLVSVGLPCLYFTSVRPMMGWWYRFLIPQLPLLAWFAAVAVSTAPARAGVRTVGLRSLGAALLVVFALAHIPPILNTVPVRHVDDQRLGEVGRRLRPWAAPDRSLSYYDIGRLPYAADWNVVDVVGLTTSRHDLRGDCGNATDLLIRSLNSSPPDPPKDIANPCPKLYDTLVDLDFFVERPVLSRRMRIFARRNLLYGEPLKRALLDDWPPAYVHDGGWLGRYQAALGDWFGQ
jgi:arabinofuranosyltransferase